MRFIQGVLIPWSSIHKLTYFRLVVVVVVVGHGSPVVLLEGVRLDPEEDEQQHAAEVYCPGRVAHAEVVLPGHDSGGLLLIPTAQSAAEDHRSRAAFREFRTKNSPLHTDRPDAGSERAGFNGVGRALCDGEWKLQNSFFRVIFVKEGWREALQLVENKSILKNSLYCMYINNNN
jgi:hypothetical protein